MEATRPQASDYLWVLLAVATGIAALLSVFDLIDAVAALGSSDLGMGHRIAPLLFAVAYLAPLGWISVGAWRRTVWGCRLAPTSDGACPRHGYRCVQVRRNTATVAR